jgi:hypothetical protein
MAPRSWFDSLGVFASAACLVHCLAFPALVAILPWLSMQESSSVTVSSVSHVTTAASLADAHDHDHGDDPSVCCLDSMLSYPAVCPTHGESRAAPPAETTIRVAGLSVNGDCCTGSGFWIHVGLLALVVPLAVLAFASGYRTHGSATILSLGLLGVCLLVAALTVGLHTFGAVGETTLSVAGSIALVSAHLWNRARLHQGCSGHCGTSAALDQATGAAHIA